jgi:predicted TIM-barrel fold metal-dependent hydrolase
VTGPKGADLTGVDMHAHVLRTDAPLVSERHSRPAREANIEEYLALLDGAGLSHGVLAAPSFYGTDNSVLLDALAAAPGRLRGTVSLPVTTDPAQLAALRERGVVGIRLNWSRRHRFPDPSSGPYQRLFAAARDAGLHIEVLIEDEHLPVLADAVLHAGAELVIDHFGLTAGPATPGTAALLRAIETGSAWVKLSAPYRPPSRRLPDVARQLVESAPRRLLWGSDWPWVSHEHDVVRYEECLAHLTALVPDAAVRRAILVDNPSSLLGLS